MNEEQFEKAYSDFINFYFEVDSYYAKKEITENETEIAGNIAKAIKALTTKYKDLDGDTLTRAEFALSQYWLSLSEITAQRVQKANTLGRWIKYKKHNEWNPAKKRLEEKRAANEKRVLVGEIEAEINKKLFAETIIEGFMESHTDRLVGLQDSLRAVLTALAHRIN